MISRDLLLFKTRPASMTKKLGKGKRKAPRIGFTIQPMVRRANSYELIVGSFQDEQFGPVILFGHGGTAVEQIDDKALGLPPLNMHLAEDLMSRTRVIQLLKGYRNQPPVNLAAIAVTLIKTAQLVIDFEEVVELDINPLLADDRGVIALDARIRIGPTTRHVEGSIRVHNNRLKASSSASKN